MPRFKFTVIVGLRVGVGGGRGSRMPEVGISDVTVSPTRCHCISTGTFELPYGHKLEFPINFCPFTLEFHFKISFGWSDAPSV